MPNIRHMICAILMKKNLAIDKKSPENHTMHMCGAVEFSIALDWTQPQTQAMFKMQVFTSCIIM